MKYKRYGVATKVHQVVLEDLEAWHQQLYERCHAVCRYEVFDPPSHWKMRPAVTLRVVVPGTGKAERELWCDYSIIGLTESGAIEAAMMRLASKALLELEADLERSERQAPLFVS
jgi:hypothetical protein